jgi:hypothetical protein
MAAAGCECRLAEGAAMKAMYVLCPDPNAAQRAVDALHATGVADDGITIISSEPFEDQQFAHRDQKTWMFWIACAGGVIGLLSATWLTRFTELSWPLSTGNMPIVAWWPNLIVMFELTMLGAILSAVLTLFVTARIPTRRSQLYDPEVMDGKILVGVENASGPSIPDVEKALLAGGAQVKRVDL